MKKKTENIKDTNLCKISGCRLMKIVGDYCLYHSKLGIVEKQVFVNKFNSQGFKSEVELFEYVWKLRTTCFVTGKSLKGLYGKDIWYNCFAHILAKGKFKEFKLYSNNICVLSPAIHSMFDNAVLDKILEYEKKHNCSFSELFELEDSLYIQYKQEFPDKIRKPRDIVEAYMKAKNTV